MARQLGFFAETERIVARTADASVRYVCGLFSPSESARLFEGLAAEIPWEATSTWMYDHEVDVPRLVAHRVPKIALPLGPRISVIFRTKIHGMRVHHPNARA